MYFEYSEYIHIQWLWVLSQLIFFFFYRNLTKIKRVLSMFVSLLGVFISIYLLVDFIHIEECELSLKLIYIVILLFRISSIFELTYSYKTFTIHSVRLIIKRPLYELKAYIYSKDSKLSRNSKVSNIISSTNCMTLELKYS